MPRDLVLIGSHVDASTKSHKIRTIRCCWLDRSSISRPPSSSAEQPKIPYRSFLLRLSLSRSTRQTNSKHEALSTICAGRLVAQRSNGIFVSSSSLIHKRRKTSEARLLSLSFISKSTSAKIATIALAVRIAFASKLTPPTAPNRLGAQKLHGKVAQFDALAQDPAGFSLIPGCGTLAAWNRSPEQPCARSWAAPRRPLRRKIKIRHHEIAERRADRDRDAQMIAGRSVSRLPRSHHSTASSTAARSASSTTQEAT